MVLERAGPFPDYDRLMIELCTNEDSKLGQVTSASQGCFVLRITVWHDLTTSRGVKYALDGIQVWCRHRWRLKLEIFIIVWISIPCTGGSPWNRLNRLRGKETRDRIMAHVTLFEKLFDASKIIAQQVSGVGGVIALEWPTGCDYWKFQAVQEFLLEHKLSSMKFDGCEFGLVSLHGGNKGVPIKKPWRFDSD